MTSPSAPVVAAAAWPPLPFDAWRDTCASLHMWLQIVGKTRLALAPMENHWWQIAPPPPGILTQSSNCATVALRPPRGPHEANTKPDE